MAETKQAPPPPAEEHVEKADTDEPTELEQLLEKMVDALADTNERMAALEDYVIKSQSSSYPPPDDDVEDADVPDDPSEEEEDNKPSSESGTKGASDWTTGGVGHRPKSAPEQLSIDSATFKQELVAELKKELKPEVEALVKASTPLPAGMTQGGYEAAKDPIGFMRKAIQAERERLGSGSLGIKSGSQSDHAASSEWIRKQVSE